MLHHGHDVGVHEGGLNLDLPTESVTSSWLAARNLERDDVAGLSVLGAVHARETALAKGRRAQDPVDNAAVGHVLAAGRGLNR